jgi:A/G-specific adenine glycosylase
MAKTVSNSRSGHASGPGTTRKMRALVSSLLGWYASHARDLPWRRSRHPYAIWVSEIMLQQTQVKTVIPYWIHWMRALPTVRSLARARPEKILKLWEGLGYYRRVHNMQKAAQLIMRRQAGRFPQDLASVRALPGIGRYTAGAICSMAYNQPTPAVDGNVGRVLARVFGVAGRPAQKHNDHLLWQLAGQLVQTSFSLAFNPKSQPTHLSSLPANQSPQTHSRFTYGDLNQALMELGALVCLPRCPQCGLCPIRRLCTAQRTSRVHELPQTKRRPATVPRHFLAFVLEYRGRWFVRQRPPGVVNARLWEFPNVELTGGDLSSVRRFLAPFGLKPGWLEPFLTFQHSITRFRITLVARQGKARQRPSTQTAPGRWLPLNKLLALPFTSAHRKILSHLRKI